MNSRKGLLRQWCDYLVSRQNETGGFYCESCRVMHGRADNAIFPLVYEYSVTGEEKYLKAAERLLNFRMLLTCSDGSVKNDFDSDWRGITAFSAINIYKTLVHFGDIIPADFRHSLEVCLDSSCKWVYENIKIGFNSYINYYAAACCADAMYGKYRKIPEYISASRQLLDYCMNHFSQNGLLCGEGQLHDSLTKKGCAPIDIGYNAEESLPCLVDAARLLTDEAAIKKLRDYTENLLYFMLPDGAWDNSTGTRNFKWTYYGSRTADGCVGALTKLGFFTAAEKNVKLLCKCTCNGALYGGMDYEKNGQKPCIHQTFCHACSLTDVLLTKAADGKTDGMLPFEKTDFAVKYFPELDTYKIRNGKWFATVTGYDFVSGNYYKGASHVTGGTISLLWHIDKGAVICGSTYDYKLTEKNNMQQYSGEKRHSSLLPRAEYESDGTVYATCLDTSAEISVKHDDVTVYVSTVSSFVKLDGLCSEDDELRLMTEYVIMPDRVEITLTLNKAKHGVVYVLPVIEKTAAVKCDGEYKTEKIFFLTGGFSADEYSIPISSAGKTRIIIE